MSVENDELRERVELEERLVVVEERRAKIEREQRNSKVRRWLTYLAFLSMIALVFAPIEIQPEIFWSFAAMCGGIITWWFHKQDKERDPLLQGIMSKFGK